MNPDMSRVVAVLDDDLAVIERKTRQLRRLADALAANDLDALSRVAEDLRITQSDVARCNEERSRLRASLAGALDTSPQNVNLSLLCSHADDASRLALEQQRQRIAVAADELARSRLTASTLLLERARLNRAFLAALFPNDDAAPIYSPAGRAPTRVTPRLVDLET